MEIKDGQTSEARISLALHPLAEPAHTRMRRSLLPEALIGVIVAAVFITIGTHFDSRAILLSALERIAGLGAPAPLAFIALYIVIGATGVASHAGEIISELTLAMVGRLRLSTIARTIHPYPTQAAAIRKIGDTYKRSRLTPRLRWLLGRWLEWRR